MTPVRIRRCRGQCGLVPLILAAWLVAGCRTGPAEIPLGQWSGDGRVVYASWRDGSSSEAATRPATIVQHYTTHLKTSEGTLDGMPILRVEILSQREKLPKLDDHSHLIVALAADSSPSKETQLYRLVAWRFNPKPGQELARPDEEPPLAASAIAHRGAVTLQIQYMDNFVETVRFAGDGVRKSGVVFNKDEGLVHWAEQLQRTHASPLPKSREADADSS